MATRSSESGPSVGNSALLERIAGTGHAGSPLSTTKINFGIRDSELDSGTRNSCVFALNPSPECRIPNYNVFCEKIPVLYSADCIAGQFRTDLRHEFLNDYYDGKFDSAHKLLRKVFSDPSTVQVWENRIHYYKDYPDCPAMASAPHRASRWPIFGWRHRQGQDGTWRRPSVFACAGNPEGLAGRC